MIWYAENDKDPETAEIINAIDTAAINCTRGNASELITDIIWKNSDLINDFLPTLSKLIVDFPKVVTIFAMSF